MIDLDFETKEITLLRKQHRGIVVANADPEERGRIKCLIEGVIESNCPPDILPWVYPKTSQAYRPDFGSLISPPVGSVVWIEFANGDVYHPMYTGAAGDGHTANVGSYGSNIRPYDGATDGQSKEPEKYDANQKASRQGPTVKKEDHVEEINYPINSIPERQEGSSAEKTWGGAFSTINDQGTQTGDVNYFSFDRVNNTFDFALKTLGIDVHIDNQGRTWVNFTNDIMFTFGAKVFAAIGGDLQTFVTGATKQEFQGDVYNKFTGALMREGDQSFIDNIKGASILKANSQESDVANHRIKASGTITRDAPSVSDTNGDGLEDSTGDNGQPKLTNTSKDYSDKQKPEHNKRMTYTSEVTRGHDLASQAAGNAGVNAAQAGLDRAKELVLSGANNRIPGGLNSSGPGGILGGGLGGILGGLVGKALGQLPGGISQIVQGVLTGNNGAVLNTVLNQTLSKLGVDLNSLPISPALLLNPQALQSTIQSIANPSALTGILTSVLRQQLASKIPLIGIPDDVIKKVVDVIMLPNKDGTLPDFQSPSGTREIIRNVPLSSNILSSLNNILGFDQGYFYQQGTTGATSGGLLKYDDPENGIAAISAHIVNLVEKYKISDPKALVREVLPTADEDTVSSVTSDISKSLPIVSPDENPLKVAVAQQSNLTSIVSPIVKAAAAVVPSSAQITGGVSQLLSSGGVHLASFAETGENGSLSSALSSVTGASSDAIDACAARPEGSVGTPANGYQYQDGPMGNEAGAGTGDDGTGDYSVPGGKMTDEQWAGLNNYNAADFQRSGMMDANTVLALDRASSCAGFKIPFTSDGRTPSTNKGAKESQHLDGKAIDINLAGMSVAQRQSVLDCTHKAGFSGFGFYKNSPNMLHVDTRASGNTWYWGGVNGQYPEWADPIMKKNNFYVGKKPFGGRANGYQADPNNTAAGNGAGTTTGKDEPIPEGVGSQPIDPPPQQLSNASREMKIEIVARTIWGEAANQGYEGQVAVGAVILNRVKDKRWPNTPENVCLQKLQFSVWNKGAGGFRSKVCGLTTRNATFRQCIAIAQKVVDGTIQDPTGGANHYHATYVTPKWKWRMQKTVQIGAHIFYRG